jgi:peptidoglycan/LPS O-acetylase OafA/YrhL
VSAAQQFVQADWRKSTASRLTQALAGNRNFKVTIMHKRKRAVGLIVLACGIVAGCCGFLVLLINWFNGSSLHSYFGGFILCFVAAILCISGT